MTGQQLRMELLDYVRELTTPHQHREHYTIRRAGTWYGQDHVTKVPPLLHQLRHAAPSGQGEDRAAGGYESRPAAPLDSLDTLAAIDRHATTWARTLGGDVDGTVVDVVRRLPALAAGLTSEDDRETRRDLERDVRRWWTWARVQTGWDSPAWRPDNTCPMCEVRGSLRVKLGDRLAFCAECHEAWDEASIGLLADHIRLESAERAPRRGGPVTCWCPVPRPPEVLPGAGRWPGLCPVCGSRWCHRVLGEILGGGEMEAS